MKETGREERREAILDAVIACERRANGKYVPASHVAAKAGISTRTMNRYFPDYDIMIFEAATKYLESRYSAIISRYNRLNLCEKNGRECLCLFLQTQIEMYEKKISDTILYIEANIRCIAIGMSKKCRKPGFGKEIGDIVVRCLEKGIKDGSIRSELNPQQTALLISSNMNGLMQRLMFLYRTGHVAIETDAIFKLMNEYVEMLNRYLVPEQE